MISKSKIRKGEDLTTKGNEGNRGQRREGYEFAHIERS